MVDKSPLRAATERGRRWEGVKSPDKVQLSSLLGPAESFLVDQVFGLIGRGRVQSDEIAVFQYRLEADYLHAHLLGLFFRYEGVLSDHFHPEGDGALGDL